MAAATVSEQNILEELNHVPHDRWDDVLDFIRSLRPEERLPSGEKRPMTAADLLHSGLIGIQPY